MYHENMEDIKILLGKRIKELRLKKGMSQEQLAEMLDIAVRNVSKIECGTNFIRADKIPKLSLALDVTPKELFNFEHLKEHTNLREEIITIMNDNPEKITEIYKVVKAITS